MKKFQFELELKLLNKYHSKMIDQSRRLYCLFYISMDRHQNKLFRYLNYKMCNFKDTLVLIKCGCFEIYH